MNKLEKIRCYFDDDDTLSAFINEDNIIFIEMVVVNDFHQIAINDESELNKFITLLNKLKALRVSPLKKVMTPKEEPKQEFVADDIPF